MIYRTFTLTTLPNDYQTDDIKDTLSFATTGAVASYEIKEDYLSPKNSTINLISKSGAVVGQIIVLIDDMGVYAMGIVTAVDNEKRQIMFRDILELFNDNALNPQRQKQPSDGLQIAYLYDGVLDTAEMLRVLYLGNVDKYRRLPLLIRTSGGGISNGEYNEPAVWSYTDNSFNVRTWLMDLFDRNNIIVQARLVFETNRAYIELTVVKNTTSGWLIKNNIPTLKIGQSEDRSPKATVCQMVYASENKEIIPNGTYYLLVDNTITTNAHIDTRVQPFRLVVAEFDQDKADEIVTNNANKTNPSHEDYDPNYISKPVPTPLQVAENELKYKDFASYIHIEIDRNSKMYPKNMVIGDAVTIVPKMLAMEQDTPILTEDEIEKYKVKTVYTGKSEKSDNSRVSLIFGKIRADFTDWIFLDSYKTVRR